MALADATAFKNDNVSQKTAEKAEKTGVYKHLMTGVSYMLPFVVAGGLLIALGFAIGSFLYGDQGIYIYDEKYAGTLGYNLFNLGKVAFELFVPILGGYIAYSIAGRPGIAPGMIGAFLSNKLGAGFLGAILAGFIAGYFVAFLSKAIKLPRSLDALKPMIILPLVGTAVIGLLMYYVIGTPVSSALAWLTEWLKSLQGSNAFLLGALLGGMMAVDMGGPINKAAYTFSVSLIASGIAAPMAATMAAGMTPPLAIFVATLLYKNRFTDEEREAGKAAGVLGLSFITEGAIPFAAKDPIRVIPALVIGSAVAGALSMLFGVTLQAPHGGIFVLFIPKAVTHIFLYALAIIAGTAVSAVLLGIFKKPLQSNA
nr:fructose-specific PTS transporter subunit EIIC [Suttonella ornithocola]